jgi:ABC-type oligopeptide transport system ATPase subunit
MERLLELVGLTPASSYLPRYPHQLSGGQRQRVAVARAIAIKPAIVIADEPLSGADVSVRGQLLNLFRSVQLQTGLGYLMITHDISIAREFANRVAVLERGEIVEQGDARAVLEQPAHAYTRRLVASIPQLVTG